VLAQAPIYGLTVVETRTILPQLKKADSVQFLFIPDIHDIGNLPAWLKTARQITNRHLFQLAKSNGAVLATLDEGIPGAFLIPRRRLHQ
jgi:hypothetical protein